jgi:glycosyltransferase involved in cell wall biosynthesis
MGSAVKIHIPSHHRRLGNAYGYSRTADEFRRALRASGVYAEEKAQADALVHITPPHLLRPKQRVLNVFFTMFEAEIVPLEYREACHRADLVVVPSRHNQRIFNRAGISTALCPLGVNVERFPFVARREFVGPRFRYLWVGAPNPRKGWPVLDQTWREYFIDEREVELYVKTTAPYGNVQHSNNIVADSRAISDTELFGLYASAHCFVFPSHGEGFGLTLAEAMATGLPAVFTPYGGVCDFANETNAYPVRARMAAVEYFGRNFAAIADRRSLAREMRSVKRDYDTAVRKGRRAAEEIRTRFTWRQAAARLAEIVAARLGRAPVTSAHRCDASLLRETALRPYDVRRY